MVSNQQVDAVLDRLPQRHRASILTFREEARRMLADRLRDLRLYGSAARGTMHDESDIDVLVLVDDLTLQDRDRLWDAAYAIDPLLHPWVADFARYHLPINRATGFYREIRRESVRL